MTFVHGPEGITFPTDKPAKLRFFLGYVDEDVPSSDGSDRVSLQYQREGVGIFWNYRFSYPSQHLSVLTIALNPAESKQPRPLPT